MSETVKETLQEEEIMPNLNSDENVAGTTHLNEEMTNEDELEKIQMEL